ncbi:alkaline phosphatase family protein [Arcanobacterium haemolyticum]|nr:alkaline phosphatase family protein [Arcanobacterium haemolyticum]
MITLPFDFVAPTSRSLRAVLSAALDAVNLPTHSLRSSYEDRLELGLPEAEKVCVVLVDGLGYENLSVRLGHAPTLRSWDRREPLTSVAPSTTAASITALGTGELPGATAMMSYSLRSPESGENFSLIKWEDPALRPEEWQKAPTLFELMGQDAASNCAVVQPGSYIGSGLSRCALRGVNAISAETPDERVDAAARALRGGARAVYLYWGELDHAGHAHGWQSEEWVDALETLDAGMRRLAHALPRGTLILLTADHGMIDVEERIDVSAIPHLCDGVELVSGEERLLHLYTHNPTDVVHRWREELGDISWVLTKEEAIATGFFGSVSDHARDVMGDVLVAQSARYSLIDMRQHKARSGFMVGVHGSLTRDEMMIPLIVEEV